MTIFQLLVYSCISSFMFDGNLALKTCRWDVRSMYVEQVACKAAGAAQIGARVFEESVSIDALHPDSFRKVELTRCDPLHIER